MKTYTLSLAAGSASEIGVIGHAFLVLDASGSLEVETDNNMVSSLEAGQGWKSTEEFKSIFITSPTTQVIKVAAGFGEFVDNRLVVSGGLNAKLKSSDTATFGSATVGVTAAVLRASNSNRKSCLVQNLGASAIYIGASSVTTANGIEIKPGQSATFYTGAALYAIGATAGLDVRYLDEVYV
jgi:hypothetical protein